MVRKFRFKPVRDKRRRDEPDGPWMLEPRDIALMGAVVFALVLLQSISHAGISSFP